MTLQDFLIAAYERRVHGTSYPEGRSDADFAKALKADPALLAQARSKLGEYDATVFARGREACFSTAIYRDVLAATLSLVEKG